MSIGRWYGSSPRASTRAQNFAPDAVPPADFGAVCRKIVQDRGCRRLASAKCCAASSSRPWSFVLAVGGLRILRSRRDLTVRGLFQLGFKFCVIHCGHLSVIKSRSTRGVKREPSDRSLSRHSRPSAFAASVWGVAPQGRVQKESQKTNPAPARSLRPTRCVRRPLRTGGKLARATQIPGLNEHRDSRRSKGRTPNSDRPRYREAKFSPQLDLDGEPGKGWCLCRCISALRSDVF